MAEQLGLKNTKPEDKKEELKKVDEELQELINTVLDMEVGLKKVKELSKKFKTACK